MDFCRVFLATTALTEAFPAPEFNGDVTPPREAREEGRTDSHSDGVFLPHNVGPSFPPLRSGTRQLDLLTLVLPRLTLSFPVLTLALQILL